MSSQFSDAYAEIERGLASRDFSSEKDWQAFLTRARKLVGPDGFAAGEASVTEDLRKKIEKAAAKGDNEAVTLFSAVGNKLSGGPGATFSGDLTLRLGALKTIRHTYLLKRFGSHKVWVVSIPSAYRDWPTRALTGGVGAVTNLLIASDERFSLEDRKNLSNASQHAVMWVHKAMSVAGNPKSSKNFALVARWFADSSSKDADVTAMASTLNNGLKKIVSKLKDGHLIYTDSVSERGTPENDGTEAFFWGDALNVVYIEEEFFRNGNTLTGLTNWTRILIHELTHMLLGTEDHAYEHQAMAPTVLGAAKALENADSWAWFCADCAGALTGAQVTNALNRR